MYLIMLLVCILLLVPVLCLLFYSIRGLTKKLIILASYLARLFAGLVLSGLFFTLPVFDKILSTGWQAILIFLFGVIIVFLMAQLAKRFRLIGYSLNFSTDSFLFLAITYLLRERITLNVLVHSVLLLIFPRFSWYLARTDEGAEEHGEEHRINRFLVEVRNSLSFHSIDHWENSRESWCLLPLQIIIASVFYTAGVGTMLFYFQPESRFPEIPIWILVTIVNVTFIITQKKTTSNRTLTSHADMESKTQLGINTQLCLYLQALQHFRLPSIPGPNTGLRIQGSLVANLSGLY